jgi:TonB family protein
MLRRFIFVLCLVSVTCEGDAEDYGIFVRHLRPENAPATAASLSLPLPAYPAELLRAGIEGYVSVRFLVSTDGAVTQVEIIAASQREFAAPVRDVVHTWRLTRSPAVSGAMAPCWMQCTIVFRTHEEDYFPAFAAGFAATRLSGRDVFRLATEVAKKDGVDVDEYSGFARADIFLSDVGHELRWGVTWTRATASGEYYRVWINDTTRAATSERKTPSSTATPAPKSTPPAPETRRP